jgi:hypothetical protein
MQINSVASGKRQNHQKNGQGPFDINAKLGVGLYTFHIINSIYLCRIACSDFYAKFMKVFILFVFKFSALLHAGIGESTIASIFALMNIPCITSRNLKKLERKAGSAIEKLATEACSVALEDEVQQSRYKLKHA